MKYFYINVHIPLGYFQAVPHLLRAEGARMASSHTQHQDGEGKTGLHGGGGWQHWLRRVAGLVALLVVGKC